MTTEEIVARGPAARHVAFTRFTATLGPERARALTGLLFVALSVKGDVLSASRSLSSRAAQTLVLFMTSVLIALLLVAPQRAAAVGWSCLLWPWSRVSLAILAGESVTLPMRAWPARSRTSPDMITAVLVGVARLTFLLNAGGGCYWLISATVEVAGQHGQHVAVPRQGDRFVRRELRTQRN